MTKDSNQIKRDAKTEWVQLGMMRVNPVAQRRFNQGWADTILSDFKPEEIGKPTVNKRGGNYYIIDGQHRIHALKAFLGEGWERQQIQCEVYRSLTEAEEADKFDLLNNKKSVNAIDTFRVRVRANRPTETDIDRIVRKEGLKITHDKSPGGIMAVGTIRNIYRDGDGDTLGRTLRIVRDSYGDSGLEAAVLGGIGELCRRYNGQLDDAMAVKKLSAARGGVSGLLSKAELLRKQTGNSRASCVAASAVELINSGGGGKKLPSWWKTAKDK